MKNLPLIATTGHQFEVTGTHLCRGDVGKVLCVIRLAVVYLFGL